MKSYAELEAMDASERIAHGERLIPFARAWGAAFDWRDRYVVPGPATLERQQTAIVNQIKRYLNRVLRGKQI